MAKIGHCSKCRRQVWLKKDGSCIYAHPPDFITNIIDLEDKAESDKSSNDDGSAKLEWYRSKSLKNLHFHSFIPFVVLSNLADIGNYNLF